MKNLLTKIKSYVFPLKSENIETELMYSYISFLKTSLREQEAINNSMKNILIKLVEDEDIILSTNIYLDIYDFLHKN